MPTNLSPGDGQDLLASFKHAREKRDPDAMVELFDEDAEYRYDPSEPALTGSIAIREYWNRVAAEEAHVDFDAERVWVSGRTVLASWHMAHTRQLSAARIRARGFSTIELDEDGKITRMRDWPSVRGVGTDSRYKPDPEATPAGGEQHG